MTTPPPAANPGLLGQPIVPGRRLSEELVDLVARGEETTLTIRHLIVALGGRAYSLLLILLALPFVTPLPLPGLSTPFGLVIALVTFRQTLGRRPWLPKRVQRRVIPRGLFERVARVSAKFIRAFESLLRPRIPFLTGHAWMRQLHAGLMCIASLTLMLPLPIPFSNAFPAWVILLMAAGLLERDGLFVLAAYGMFVIGTVYFLLLGHAFNQLWDHFQAWVLG